MEIMYLAQVLGSPRVLRMYVVLLVSMRATTLEVIVSAD